MVAHRGDHAQAHENTIEAFLAAAEGGADMVEFDIRRCADGELIVHHDADIAGRKLSAIGYPEALRLASGLGYRIPRLTETLRRLAGRIFLDIELKETGCEEAVLAAVLDAVEPDDFVITSFQAPALARVRALLPGVRLGLLIAGTNAAPAFDAFRNSAAGFLAPHYAMLDAETLEAAARSRIALLPWTVNDPAEVARFLKAPAVFGIITDQVAEALRIREAA